MGTGGCEGRWEVVGQDPQRFCRAEREGGARPGWTRQDGAWPGPGATVSAPESQAHSTGAQGGEEEGLEPGAGLARLCREGTGWCRGRDSEDRERDLRSGGSVNGV